MVQDPATPQQLHDHRGRTTGASCLTVAVLLVLHCPPAAWPIGPLARALPWFSICPRPQAHCNCFAPGSTTLYSPPLPYLSSSAIAIVLLLCWRTPQV
ncbi:unnamed protein product [Gadus morhua 'NCC']